MKILLIAYDFPPIISAQSLRWFYLSNELARLGVQIDVLCPTLQGLKAFSRPFHPNVTMHRAWPGPYVAFSQALAARYLGAQISSVSDVGRKSGLLQAAYRATRAVLNNLVYPDIRTEWLIAARPRLRRLLAASRYDAVISSYEPGVDLMLGMWAKRRFDIKWIVDFGDPIVGTYSAPQRLQRDQRFEDAVTSLADSLVFTTQKAVEQFRKRQAASGLPPVFIVPQGFAMHDNGGASVEKNRDNSRLHMVFTGTFYKKFRNPQTFADAMRLLDDDRLQLTIAGDNDSFVEMFKGVNNVRFLGKIDHFECLDLQYAADLLLSVGNVQDEQIPGKLFEYLGTSIPILHIRTGVADDSEALLKKLRAGLSVENSLQPIVSGLREVMRLWEDGDLRRVYRVDTDALHSYSWSSRAATYLDALSTV